MVRDPRQNPHPGDILMRNGSKITVLSREPDLIAYQRNGYMGTDWCSLEKWQRDMVQGYVLERGDLDSSCKRKSLAGRI